MAAVADQQIRAVRADRAVLAGLAALRGRGRGSIDLDALRAGHEELAVARRRAAHERSIVRHLEMVADERRAALVSAGQDREAIAPLRVRAPARRRGEGRRLEGVATDDLAVRRVRRRRFGAAA